MTVAVTGAERAEQLVNGEAVEVDVRYARIGSRGLALLLDLMAQVLLAILLLVVIQIITLAAGAEAALVQAMFTVGLILVFVGYPTAVETFTNGRSPGKRALGLRVVREDGGPIRVRHALVRSLVGLAVEWPGLLFPPLTWAVALTTMLFSPQGRRLGDLAAGTFVIHERSAAPWGWSPVMPPAYAGWAAQLDLTNLDDELALAARHYLARAAQIRQPMNGQFAYSLATEVSAKIGVPVPPGIPAWAYLSAILAERRRRAADRAQASRALTQRIWPGFGRLEWAAPRVGPTWDPAVTHPPLLGVMKEDGVTKG
ncbi:RDD family protein [Actinoplanes sp. NPDC051859]|uniref:RDD family protein n=1 Tax=Actinoplanes sp. NPDC051859 TaxID=3363909 RepID=UPI00379281FC